MLVSASEQAVGCGSEPLKLSRICVAALLIIVPLIQSCSAEDEIPALTADTTAGSTDSDSTDGDTTEAGDTSTTDGDATDGGAGTDSTDGDATDGDPTDGDATGRDSTDGDSTGGDTTGGQTDGDTTAGSGDTTGDTTGESTGDTGDSTGDTGGDTGATDGGGPDACEVDTDCDGAHFCTDTPEGKTCTYPCDDGSCPDEWICGLAAGEFQCVPLHPTLCDPCVSSTQCAGFIAGAACVVLGENGSYCASGCDLGCPTGFDCQSVGTVDGGISNQCVPVEGAGCDCSVKAISQSLSTTCQVANNSGTCAGTRTCTADGLTDCDAPIPSPDVCDGADNDCDGETDETLAVVACQLTNEFGVCPGQLSCVEGSPSCVGDAPAEESCDDQDNDCDDVIDPEDTPGCVSYWLDGDGDGFGLTDDSRCLCAASGFHSATKPGDCDDNDPDKFPQDDCIVICNIFMLSGLCGDSCGSPAPAAPCPGGYICQDSVVCRTECTTDDHCQPGLFCDGSECVATAVDGQPCSFDNECLSKHCAKAAGEGDGGWCCSGPGACCGGQDAHCADGNVCTAATCNGSFQCDVVDVDAQCADAACDGLSFSAASTCVGGACPAAQTQDCGGSDTCHVYTCSPDGGCADTLASAATTCESAGCFDYEDVAAKTCDAQGGCSQGGGASICPNGYACKNNETGCRTHCNDDSHCQPDTYCNDGDCLEKLEHGEACQGDGWCISGNCQADVCCDGCCDFGTLGSDDLPGAMELCGYDSLEIQGPSQCRRIIADFGNFSHSDSAVEGGDSAMVHLSTGSASNTGNQQNGQNLQTNGADPDGSTNGNVFDLCGFEVTLKAPPGAKGFAFDFLFFSSEYPEWVGSQFNDSFNVMMSSQVFDNQNIAFDSNLNPISINVAFFTICNGDGCSEPASTLQGTGFDDGVGGATGWLTTTVPVIPNETFTIRFVVYDEGDHIFNSETLINNFRWLEFVSGTGPVTE
jgi:hypothetical protein